MFDILILSFDTEHFKLSFEFNILSFHCFKWLLFVPLKMSVYMKDPIKLYNNYWRIQMPLYEVSRMQIWLKNIRFRKYYSKWNNFIYWGHMIVREGGMPSLTLYTICRHVRLRLIGKSRNFRVSLVIRLKTSTWTFFFKMTNFFIHCNVWRTFELIFIDKGTDKCLWNHSNMQQKCHFSQITWN